MSSFDLLQSGHWSLSRLLPNLAFWYYSVYVLVSLAFASAFLFTSCRVLNYCGFPTGDGLMLKYCSIDFYSFSSLQIFSQNFQFFSFSVAFHFILQGVFCINCCIFGSPYLCNTCFTLIINAFVLFFVILSCLSIILYSTVVLSCIMFPKM